MQLSRPVVGHSWYRQWLDIENLGPTIVIQGVSQLLKQSDWAQIQDFK